MCEYTTLQCERSNKKNMVVMLVVAAAAEGGVCGEGSPDSRFMKFRYCSLRLMKQMAKGLPQLTMERTVVRWCGGPGL